MANLATGIQTMEDIISILRQFSNWNSMIAVGKITEGTVDAEEISDTNVYMQCTEGNAGATPTADEWLSAYQASKAYYEAYSVILSHIHQHLPTDYTKVYTSVAADVHNIFEQMLYVEVPKYAPDTRTPATPEETLSALKTLVQTIGAKKEVAYFGGGIKYYNEEWLSPEMRCAGFGSGTRCHLRFYLRSLVFVLRYEPGCNRIGTRSGDEELGRTC